MQFSEKKKRRHRKTDILQITEKGILPKLIEEYIVECSGNDKFPNIAGFCRFCGIGQGELADLGTKFPKEHDALYSVFEDEALNSDIAAALVNPYMKKRLGYGDEPEKKKDNEAVSVIFRHDISKDGE